MEEEIKKYTEGVSVVIVTYNGSERLLPTLTHLAHQKNIHFNFEIILVDNNSNDDTSAKAAAIWQELGTPFNFRIILEAKPGTMHARERGIKEVAYRYMLYCDDDNWLSPEYVSTAYSIIKENNTIAAIGGNGILEFEKGFNIPGWIWRYEKNFGGVQGKEDGDITNEKGCLYTAGTLLDIKWLDRLYAMGFQSTLKGRDDKSLVAGEDTELTYALRIIGGKLYYSSKMTFKHYMPAGRINWAYLNRLWYSYGVADYILSPYGTFFNKKKDTPYLINLFLTLKHILVLKLKIIFKQPVEGDKLPLLLEKRKGELKSILNYKSQFKACKKNIKILSAVNK